MIVVDTNVVSELMRPSPSSQVRDWISAQAPGELCTTAVTVAIGSKTFQPKRISWS